MKQRMTLSVCLLMLLMLLCLLTGRFLETLDPAEVDVVLKAARLFSEFVSDDANFPGNPRR